MKTTFLSLSAEELKEQFYKLRTREDIAALLQVSDYQLRYHLYIYPREKAYATFQIPKKSGGSRSISAPKTSLKIIQQKLNQVFISVYQPKPSTHGFAVEKSIVTNAKQHLRQKYVLNLDLKDFFPSINFGRVRGLLMSPPYSCTMEVATVLAQICCHDNQLPQGAPTSPIISNMICAKLDSQLQRLAKKYQCIYTRYADDITFSTSRSKFPPHLIWFSKEAEKSVLGDELKTIIEENGFLVNESKVRLQTRYKRQEVTGITVNEKLNVKRKYIRQIRAVLHAWEKYGLSNAESEFWKHDKKHRFQVNQDSFRNIIRGRIEFVGAVRGKNDPIYLNFLRWLKKLAPDLVSDAKFDLFGSQNPPKIQKDESPKAIIWTEGKTDLKHLKSALKWLENNGEKYGFKLDFKEDLDDQRQGSSELLKMCEQFCKERQTQPIIAIFDRDEPDFIRKAHDEARGFKDWRNGVYSFALPIPKHRQDVSGICIELYYQDEEIQRKDNNARRLFLSKEFNDKSGKHYDDLQLNTTNKIKSSQLKIIDDNVFDRNHNNVALSKDKFADYILNNAENFNDFNFEEFQEVFKVIENILKHHSELLVEGSLT
ncbi:MAG: reverse transcriptase domain-containing protein [Pseudanabaena sp.]